MAALDFYYHNTGHAVNMKHSFQYTQLLAFHLKLQIQCFYSQQPPCDPTNQRILTPRKRSGYTKALSLDNMRTKIYGRGKIEVLPFFKVSGGASSQVQNS